MRTDDALILIGMPAAGKSTIGQSLARRLGRRFVDTDELIVSSAGHGLQQILDAEGYLGLRAREERAILDGELRGAVVATGGSAVYSAEAMRKLAACGPLVLLDVSLSKLRTRLSNFSQRGIASPPGQQIDDIYLDRKPRYQSYADLIVEVDGRTEGEVCDAVLAAVADWTPGKRKR